MANRREKNIVAAFTEEQAERLTGISVRQLRHWDRTGFFAPSLAYQDRSKPFSRLYSFRDLVSLKVLNALRNDAQVSLPHLRTVKEKLAHLGEDVWAKTTLYVLNKKVVFENPLTRAKEEIVTGQGVLQIPLRVVTGNMTEAINAMRQRDSHAVGKIEKRRGFGGHSVIAGTRIPVQAIKAFAEEGYTLEQIQKEYPTLTRDDIAAAIAHDEAA